MARGPRDELDVQIGPSRDEVHEAIRIAQLANDGRQAVASVVDSYRVGVVKAAADRSRRTGNAMRMVSRIVRSKQRQSGAYMYTQLAKHATRDLPDVGRQSQSP